MKRARVFTIAMCIAMTPPSFGEGQDISEGLLRNLPPAVVLENSVEIPPAQAEAIGQKLGGKIQHLTNSIVRVHGRRVQVNAITATDEVSAKSIYASLSKIKSPPFCLRKGNVIIELVGKHVDDSLAIKTTYELGFEPKPASVRYRVTADLATVQEADYMSCNPLFQLLVATQLGSTPAPSQQIKELTQNFSFGRRLVLRSPVLESDSTTHTFHPREVASIASRATVTYSFDQPPVRQGIPFVTATVETTVVGTGFRPWPALPTADLTAETPYWPTSDPNVIALARRITDGKSTHDSKVAAILEWLTPGRNLRYSGQTGSRWGTTNVLKQEFGHCWDFADCFITLAGAAGVPTRQVAGWFFGSSGHVWAEFYREDQGWQQVDPTGGGKLLCGIYHIPYFTSEDGAMPILYVAMPKVEIIPTK